MSAPDPESFSLLQKVMGAAAAIVTPIYGVYKVVETKLDKKADKSEVDRHRDYFVKVFDKMEEHTKRDAEMFSEIKDMMHANHAELLREMGRKADR